MKKILRLLILSVTIILTGCTKTIDKSINIKDLEKIKSEISSDKNNSSMKSKYIIDKLTEQVSFLELGKKMAEKLGKDTSELKVPTFSEEIKNLSISFDSIRNSKNQIIENNKKLDNFINLIDAKATSIDKYKGYLSFKIKFNNKFEKEVLYIILNYKYINKYDTKFFDKKTKLTDEVAEDFQDEIEITTSEKYNNVADFLYSKVPMKANKLLIDKLGLKEANEKVQRDFLMEGLKIETLGIIFKDKTELFKKNADWEYLEN
jgi:hypothetical protein